MTGVDVEPKAHWEDMITAELAARDAARWIDVDALIERAKIGDKLVMTLDLDEIEPDAAIAAGPGRYIYAGSHAGSGFGREVYLFELGGSAAHCITVTPLVWAAVDFQIVKAAPSSGADA